MERTAETHPSPPRLTEESSQHLLMSLTTGSLREFRQLEPTIQEQVLNMSSTQQAAEHQARASRLRSEHVLGLQPFDVEKKRLEIEASGIRWGAFVSAVSIAAGAYAAASGVALGVSIGSFVFGVPTITLVVNIILRRR